MSSSTEVYSAWVAVVKNLATAHAVERQKTYVPAMREYGEIPHENKPVVSPLGVLIAEIIGSISILGAELTMQKHQARQSGNREAYMFFSRIEQQVENAACTVRDIDLF